MIHLFQSIFVTAGDGTVPVTYHVEHVSTSNRFATRKVTAKQGETVIFLVNVSCTNITQHKKLQHGMCHRYSMPIPSTGQIMPEQLPSGLGEFMPRFGLSQEILDYCPKDPWDWRHLPLTLHGQDPSGSESPTGLRVYGFVRSETLDSREPRVHLAALGWLTDSWFVGTPTLANPQAAGMTAENVRMQASINHSIYFHEDMAKVDDWILVERQTSWADNGRVLLEQRFWDWRSGKLIVSSQQETFVRLHAPKL